MSLQPQFNASRHALTVPLHCQQQFLTMQNSGLFRRKLFRQVASGKWKKCIRRFSAGCQPRHPFGNLIAAGIKVPGADSPYLPGAGSISSRISNRLGLLPAQAQYSFYVPPHGARLGDYSLKSVPSKQLRHKHSQTKYLSGLS